MMGNSKSGFLTRRGLLLSLLGAGGVAALGGLDPLLKLARAQEASGKDHYFIFCYFSGGWDILLGLDPRDPAVFNYTNMDETLIQPGYSTLRDTSTDGQLVYASEQLVFGPYIGDLARYPERLAVVRGMSMETLTHEIGRRRFLTGQPPSGINARGSSISTWLAAQLGSAQMIPNLSVQVENYNVDQPAYASALQIQDVNDLLRALRPGSVTLSDQEEAQIDLLLTTVAACSGAQKSGLWMSSETSRGKVREVLDANLAGLFDFLANTPEMEAIRSHYGISNNSSALRSPEAQAATAVTALTSGLSRCVSIQVAGGLDSHYGSDWAFDHGPTQRRGFNAVARMMEDLAAREYLDTGTSWLDHTTLIGFSEFSRTALLNSSGGRDHSLTNACFLAGGGIRGNQAIGRSSDVGMAPTLTSLSTGESDDGGEVIRPEHVLRTLFELAGVSEDVADLRVEPITALLGG